MDTILPVMVREVVTVDMAAEAEVMMLPAITVVVLVAAAAAVAAVVKVMGMVVIRVVAASLSAHRSEQAIGYVLRVRCITLHLDINASDAQLVVLQPRNG